MTTPDIIVVGASMGGVTALSDLLTQLPASLPASVFIVLHTAPHAPAMLADILARKTELTVVSAHNGDRIQRGWVYVAPPDYHLLVKRGHVHVTRGPKENRVRPAIDPLFRSAAVAYGPRVIGIVLTGYQDDGAAGLAAIKRCGGLAIVQDPDDALYPDMPRSALRATTVDYQLPLAAMGQQLLTLTHQPLAETAFVPPEELVLEAGIAEKVMCDVQTEEALGELVPFVCPECQGPLWQIEHGRLPRYRCHIGHAFTAHALLTEQQEAIDRSLGSLLRAFEERGNFLDLLVQYEAQNGHTGLVKRYEQVGAEAHRQTDRLQDLVADQSKLSLMDTLPDP
jgi:two-component system chemotaxis response regulator CheB